MIFDLIKKINLRPKNLHRLYAGLVFLGMFTIFTVIESLRVFNKFDPSITRIFQKIIPRTLDTPLSYFSIFGSIELTTIILLLIIAVIFYKNKIILPSLGLFGAVMVFELIGKFFVFHPGPPKFFFRYDLPFSTPEYLSTSYSYPSGHVGRTSFIIVVAIIMALKFAKTFRSRAILTAILLAWLLVMSISRIYLGEHWASDVIGGLLLGTAMGFFAMVYYD